jgi:hypothetical protein
MLFLFEIAIILGAVQLSSPLLFLNPLCGKGFMKLKQVFQILSEEK